MDLPFLLYGIGLAAAMAAASLTVTAYPDPRLARGALVVFANWLLGTIFALTTQVTDSWWFNLVIDAAAAVLIVRPPLVRWQGALGATYVVQFGLHLLYGGLVTAGGGDAWRYYWLLTIIAWLQLLLIGGWSAEVWRRGAREGRG